MGHFNSFIPPKIEPKSEPMEEDPTPELLQAPSPNQPIINSLLSPSISVKDQLWRLAATKPRDLDQYREMVRKSRLIYDSLRRHIIYEAEKSPSVPGTRLRADSKAASIMKTKGIDINPDMKIVGSVPGISIGDVFLYRCEMNVLGLHCQTQAGVDYFSRAGYPVATSVITSCGGYEEDDEDHGEVLTYSGNGQRMEGGNLGMLNSMEYGFEVRVVRGFLNDGVKVYVYDGLYRVTHHWVHVGGSGFRVFKFRLERLGGQEEMGSRRFYHAYSVRTLLYRDGPIHGYLTKDLSGRKERVPVPMFNDVDSDTRLELIEYVANAVYPQTLHLYYNVGERCECVEGCGGGGCVCAVKNGGEFAYDSHGFLSRGRSVIHECGSLCKCPPTCKNRVSQSGLKRRLEVFRTREAEPRWSVRTLEMIQAGSFICEFSGLVLTNEQARVISMGGEEPIYASRFKPTWTQWGGDLSKVLPDYAPPKPGLELPPLEFAVEVSCKRNVGAYMRLGSSPNVMVQFVMYDHSNLNFPHIMLFAMEAIAPMKELTIAYDYE